MTDKLDMKKTLRTLYTAPAQPVQVEVPPLSFLMIDGEGDPNTAPAYRAALEALYSVAYTLKFASKAAGIDFAVMPLQGLWWSDDMTTFTEGRKDEWHWTMMIAQPNHITPEMLAAAVVQVRAKKNPEKLDAVRLDTYHEGLAAQIMHIGSYSAEAPTIQRLHAWIAAQGFTITGAKPHHEIYLGDPNRTAPDKLKTIIRQPMRPA